MLNWCMGKRKREVWGEREIGVAAKKTSQGAFAGTELCVLTVLRTQTNGRK